VRGTSRLSPYLHFGNIGPLTIALAVKRRAQGKASPSAARQISGAVDWLAGAGGAVCAPRAQLRQLGVRGAVGRKTLVEHAGDPRPYRYSLKQLERAETADELWNAAQREMVQTGWMHNYMRMYWAKKILEWAPDPARAFEWAVTLNDRYELDGRDPNGYAGIAWAIVGRHDRPWFNRPVFGLVRTMTGASTAKKFDAARYIRPKRGRAGGCGDDSRGSRRCRRQQLAAEESKAAERRANLPPRVAAAERFLAQRGWNRDRRAAAWARAGRDRALVQAAAQQAQAQAQERWQSLGPVAVQSQNFGLVTGRISALALDPSDATGNTALRGNHRRRSLAVAECEQLQYRQHRLYSP
jgi:hypothetical protein